MEQAVAAKQKASSGKGSSGTRPFSPFEWMMAGRYLRARRKEGFISVIAGFSFTGIMLGVATLIIVMAVMNGFRKELLGKILGINGHVLVQAVDKPMTDFAELAQKLSKVPGVKMAVPLVEGQALASSPYAAAGALVRGIRESDLARLPSVSGNIRAGSLSGFDKGEGIAIGKRLADQLAVGARRPRDAGVAARRGDADRHHAAAEILQGGGDLRSRHVGVRPDLHLHAACPRRRPISTARAM